METISIKELISNNKIDAALDALKWFWEEHQSLPDECSLLKNQLKRATDAQNAGTQSMGEKDVLENRLILALLEKINDFEKQCISFLGLNKHFDTTTDGFKERIEHKFSNIFAKFEEISVGDTAIIYLATELSTSKKIVIKALKSYDFVSDSSIKKELKIMSKLDHRNIMDIDYSHVTTYPICTILKFINGIDLKKIVNTSGKRTFAETREIILKLLDSMHYLHEKAIYVKYLDPDNIIIDTEGEPTFSPPFKILKPDFEARTLKQLKEDFAYMSNLQIANNTFNGSVKCNLYSIGLLTYFLLTGEDLFKGDSLPELLADRHGFFNNIKYQKEKLKKLYRSDVPESFIKILVRLLTEKYNGNASQLITLIQDCQTSESDIQLLVKESYNRAFFRNDDFLNSFYTPYLTKPDSAKNLFKKISTFNAQKQAQMMHYTINLIIETSDKNYFLDQIFQQTGQDRLPIDEFRNFLYMLKEAVKSNDNLWYESTEKAWEEVIQINLNRISQLFTVQ